MSAVKGQGMMDPSITINADNEIKPPSKRFLLWLHISQLFIWFCQWQWPFVALQAKQDNDTYCRATYWDGYNSPNCSGYEMTECYDDIRCGLKADWYGYDDNFWCSSDSDCSECECVASQTYQATMITLFVFLGIGSVLEIIRLILACVVLGTTPHYNDNKLFLASIADGVQLRCVQMMNPAKYRKEIINIHYNQRTIFKYRVCCIQSPWHVLDFLLHHLPVYISVFVLLGTDAFDGESWYQYPLIFISLIIYVLNKILKLRFGNLKPYISPDVAPNFNAPNLDNNNNQQFALVLANYNAVDNNQLSIIQGERVKIMGVKNQFGWILAMKQDGSMQSGYVPFGYLQM